MKSFAGPPLRLSDDLRPLLHLGTCFQLSIDGNSNAVLRRGVVVAPASTLPIWYDDCSFAGGFTTETQRLFQVDAKIPPHLSGRVLICPIPENEIEAWKTDRVVECVRQSCGEVVHQRRRRTVAVRKDGEPRAKPGRKKKTEDEDYQRPERVPKEVPVDASTLSVEVDFEDAENLLTDARATLTFSACMAYLKAAKDDVARRVLLLEEEVTRIKRSSSGPTN